MPALSREIQRRFAGAALVVDVGAVIEQKANDFCVPRQRGCEKRGFAESILPVDRGVLVEQ